MTKSLNLILPSLLVPPLPPEKFPHPLKYASFSHGNSFSSPSPLTPSTLVTSNTSSSPSPSSPTPLKFSCLVLHFFLPHSRQLILRLLLLKPSKRTLKKQILLALPWTVFLSSSSYSYSWPPPDFTITSFLSPMNSPQPPLSLLSSSLAI